MKNLIAILLLFSSLSLQAQEIGTDKLGNWLMYFGMHRLSDDLSIHTEAQFRYYELTSNLNQVLLRTGLNYHINSKAMVTAGYAYIPTESFEKGANQVSTRENRIWQQFILRNKVGRFNFEHRYRLEQRWVRQDEETNYLNRARYRIFIAVPISKPAMEDKTWFLAAYDEIFLDLDSDPFNQNRLYGAVGYKFNSTLSLQAGYLRNHIGPNCFNRVQFALFLNTDHRKNK
ncbi:MAG: DUF2490 domain-containing protein [Bacteroidia bacterium]|nr:DUF2490 domain-containing protein [Bacteroidia bacterium]